MRQTLCVDFDGVIHMYTTRWTNEHTVSDGPVPGAIVWLYRMLQKYDIVIHSARCRTWRGRRAIRRWLKHHAGTLWYESMGHRGLEEIIVWPTSKPVAVLYIDDRGWRFEGGFPYPDEIEKLKQWNKE